MKIVNCADLWVCAVLKNHNLVPFSGCATWSTDELGANIALPSRDKGVEVIGAARARVEPGYGSQPHPIDPPCVAIHAGQRCFLSAINPKCQAAVIGTRSSRRLPIKFNRMLGVGDRKPIRDHPGATVIQQPSLDLIGSAVEAEANS